MLSSVFWFQALLVVAHGVSHHSVVKELPANNSRMRFVLSITNVREKLAVLNQPIVPE